MKFGQLTETREIFYFKNHAENEAEILQLCTKYIGNLLGFTEKLDLKQKFNVTFWLFSGKFAFSVNL